MTEEQALEFMRMFFGISPDAERGEKFRLSLIELEAFTKELLRKASN